MPDTKHYVYSARTTRDGLAVLNKTRGDRSWDSFVNEAVCAHYGLDTLVMSLPKVYKAEKPQKEKKAASKGKHAEEAESNQQPEEGTIEVMTVQEIPAEEPPKKKRGKGKGKK
jgi:hypothetical protein